MWWLIRMMNIPPILFPKLESLKRGRDTPAGAGNFSGFYSIIGFGACIGFWISFCGTLSLSDVSPLIYNYWIFSYWESPASFLSTYSFPRMKEGRGGCLKSITILDFGGLEHGIWASEDCKGRVCAVKGSASTEVFSSPREIVREFGSFSFPFYWGSSSSLASFIWWYWKPCDSIFLCNFSSPGIRGVGTLELRAYFL